jgi:DNA-binding NarL/FixJ family response regulator
VLLIQHDPADAMVVQRALSAIGTQRFRLQWVTTLGAGLEALAADRAVDKPAATVIAAILVDWLLLDNAGADAFGILFKAARHIPILVLSTPQDEERSRHAVRLGAQDYLLKDRVDDYNLPKALTNMIERMTISNSLQSEAARAHMTLNSIGDAVVSTGIDGRITYLNEVAETMTG